jgi:hypothetical protein
MGKAVQLCCSNLLCRSITWTGLLLDFRCSLETWSGLVERCSAPSMLQINRKYVIAFSSYWSCPNAHLWIWPMFHLWTHPHFWPSTYWSNLRPVIDFQPRIYWSNYTFLTYWLDPHFSKWSQLFQVIESTSSSGWTDLTFGDVMLLNWLNFFQ